ncbi:ABC transporter ATP-binding protein, partial [Streptomyces angustmyceticus]
MAEQKNGIEPAKAAEARIPTVIADDLHIVYRVYGTGAGKGSATAA